MTTLQTSKSIINRTSQIPFENKILSKSIASGTEEYYGTNTTSSISLYPISKILYNIKLNLYTNSTNWKLPKMTTYNINDSEIMSMSPDEIKAEVLAAFGAWADREDITDEWLEILRQSWNNRLDELYSDES